MARSPASSTEADFREMRDRAREMFPRAARMQHSARLLRHMVYRDGDCVSVRKLYDLSGFERVLVVSIGKAGHTMAEALSNIVGSGLNWHRRMPQ